MHIHDTEGANERKRYGNRRNDRRRHVPQEDEHDHDDQRDGEHQFELDVFHRGANSRRPVGQDFHIDRGGQAVLQGGQDFLDPVGDGDDIGARLTLDGQDDGGGIACPCGKARVFRTVENGRHVGQAHGAPSR